MRYRWQWRHFKSSRLADWCRQCEDSLFAEWQRRARARGRDAEGRRWKRLSTCSQSLSMCEALKGARMSAHNAIAERTTSAITAALRSIHPEWNPVHEQSAARVWEEITTGRLTEATRRMKTDVVLMNKTLRRAHILEFRTHFYTGYTLLPFIKYRIRNRLRACLTCRWSPDP